MEEKKYTRGETEKAAWKAALETLENNNISETEKADIFCKYVSAAMSIIRSSF